jgi:hypothetical protein
LPETAIAFPGFDKRGFDTIRNFDNRKSTRITPIQRQVLGVDYQMKTEPAPSLESCHTSHLQPSTGTFQADIHFENTNQILFICSSPSRHHRQFQQYHLVFLSNWFTITLKNEKKPESIRHHPSGSFLPICAWLTPIFKNTNSSALIIELTEVEEGAK